MKQSIVTSNPVHSKRKKGTSILWGIALFLVFIGIVIFLAAQQYGLNFGVPFQSFLYTIANSKEGADVTFVFDMVLDALPLLLVFCGIAGIFAYCFLQTRLSVSLVIGKKRPLRIPLRPVSGWIALVISFVILISSVSHFDQVVGISAYVEMMNQPCSTVYETYYVNAKDASILPPSEKKNLIHIYLESMEVSYASREDGGNQETNYIPFATKLAQGNLSFSNTDRLGGFVALPGTTWTIGSLFASQTGTPFAFPVDSNDMSNVDVFAPSLVGLGDILEQNGYVQEFMCGSDIKFAGRDIFFRDHGSFQIYDYFTAIEQGLIPKDYFVFWGFEDSYLYNAAKTELVRLSQQDQPFNFTMLTVDPHHIGGYICDLCDPYDGTETGQIASVLTCADRQLEAFIQWLQQQPFYEDSVVVITGDHPRMDTLLVENLGYYDRRVYNCFLNSAYEATGSTTFREFSTMDMFPTVLAALGFEIDGDRLGFGTNLFSQRPTLIEEYSLDFWHVELQKRSEYFDTYIAN